MENSEGGMININNSNIVSISKSVFLNSKDTCTDI